MTKEYGKSFHSIIEEMIRDFEQTELQIGYKYATKVEYINLDEVKRLA